MISCLYRYKIILLKCDENISTYRMYTILHCLAVQRIHVSTIFVSLLESHLHFSRNSFIMYNQMLIVYLFM